MHERLSAIPEQHENASRRAVASEITVRAQSKRVEYGEGKMYTYRLSRKRNDTGNCTTNEYSLIFNSSSVNEKSKPLIHAIELCLFTVRLLLKKKNAGDRSSSDFFLVDVFIFNARNRYLLFLSNTYFVSTCPYAAFNPFLLYLTVCMNVYVRFDGSSRTMFV